MDKTAATPSGKSIVSGVENHFVIKEEYLDIGTCTAAFTTVGTAVQLIVL